MCPRFSPPPLECRDLFSRIIDLTVSRFGECKPRDIVELILGDPYGSVCDGIVSLYPNPDSDSEYFVRMHSSVGVTSYDLHPGAMKAGYGGFLKAATTLKSPELYIDITDKITDADRKSLPWIDSMKTSLIVPTTTAKGEAATTILFSTEVDGFDGETVKSNVFMTYAVTNIILTWIHRMEAVTSFSALDDELKSIGKIQRSMLPQQVPDSLDYKWAVHYATCARAGGDYYDFFQLGDSKLGVVIADVSGHGSPTSIAMAMTRLLLHTYPGEVAPPKDVLVHLNTILKSSLMPGRFVTAFYAVLDAKRREVTFSSAGNPPPLIYRAESKSVEELKSESGLPLGVLSNGMYVEQTEPLGPGDVVLFFTDGIAETVNAAGQVYSVKRLKTVLARSIAMEPEGIKEALLDDLNRFAGDEPSRNDITFLVMRVGG